MSFTDPSGFAGMQVSTACSRNPTCTTHDVSGSNGIRGGDRPTINTDTHRVDVTVKTSDGKTKTYTDVKNFDQLGDAVVAAINNTIQLAGDSMAQVTINLVEGSVSVDFQVLVGQNELQGVINAYEQFYSTLEQRIADNPKGAIELSNDESALLFKGHFYKTLQQDRRDKFSGNYDEKHIIGHFSGGVADTILRDFSHRQFSINGEVAWGGHINYIGVGMLAAHYGPNAYQAIPGMVAVHNIGQVFGANGGGGLRNLRDIGPGTKWALRGANYYNANSR